MLSKQFSKKALVQQFLKNANAAKLASSQQRFLQTPYKPGTPITFMDAMSGIYEDPLYACKQFLYFKQVLFLTLKSLKSVESKPLEWRDEQTVTWTSFGSILAIGPNMFAIFLAAFCLAWYSFTDNQSILSSSNPHPFFEIKEAKNWTDKQMSFFTWTMPFGVQNYTARTLFTEEIKHAINSKKQ